MENYTPTFTDKKAKVLNNIKKYSDDLRARALKRTTSAQREGWPLKGYIALNIIKGVATDAEILTVQREIDARGLGETVEELAQKQQAKALMLINFDNAIEGTAKYSNGLVNAASTEAELDDAFASIKEIRAALESSLPK